MSQPTTQRPPQVTLAGSIVMFSSVIVVLSVWERVGSLRSLESRASLEQIIATPPWSGIGLDLEGAMRLIHVSGLVAAGCATVTAGLGWLVMRRDTTARLVLAVLAVPIFLTGLLVGGFASSFVAAAAAMLWLSPAREWFATGRWTPPPSPQSRAAERERRPAGPPVGDPGPGTAPPAPPPPGSAPYAGSTVAPYGDAPQQHPHPWSAMPPERPGALLAAVVLTTTMSVLVGLVGVMVLVVAALSPELLLAEFERQQPSAAEGVSLAQLRNATYVTGAAFVGLSVLALTLAGFVTVGRDWARRGLMITAAFCAGACFLGALTLPMALLPAGAAIVTVALLGRPESRAWCQAERPTRQS